tara:strand:- start:15 stop:659 length:645 start_codon:yes stop_codon:yes gene_type:complete
MPNPTMTKFDFTNVISTRKYDFTKQIALYNDTVERAHKVYNSEGDNGGKVRAIMGSLFETIAYQICMLVNPNLVILHNDYKTLALEDDDGNVYTNDVQVDHHVYLRDELVLIIECKTYLDKSMLTRAIDNFKEIRIDHAITSDKVLPCAILTGQNSVNKNRLGYAKCLQPFDLFLLNSTEKRSSKKPIYQTLDPLNVNKCQRFADYVYNIVGNS